MEIRVKVKTGAKRESVSTLPDGRLAVSVKARPLGGAANIRAIALVAAHLGIPISRVRIVRGHTTPSKTISIKT